jgi:hypothetical protein
VNLQTKVCKRAIRYSDIVREFTRGNADGEAVIDNRNPKKAEDSLDSLRTLMFS